MRITHLWGGERWQSLLGDLSHTLALERFGPSLTERIFWQARTEKPIVALSFDDGPHPTFTRSLLDYFDREQVPATFFLIGRYVQRNPELARRIAGAAHEIGNHTWSHRMLPFLPVRQIREEISRTHEIISEVTGRMPLYFRPPMGLFTKKTVSVVEQMGYRHVVGDVYPRDPNRPGTKKIIRRVLKRVRPGSLIILHDGGNTRNLDRSQTVQAVQEIVPRLKDQGYRFVTLSELVQSDTRAGTG